MNFQPSWRSSRSPGPGVAMEIGGLMKPEQGGRRRSSAAGLGVGHVPAHRSIKEPARPAFCNIIPMNPHLARFYRPWHPRLMLFC